MGSDKSLEAGGKEVLPEEPSLPGDISSVTIDPAVERKIVRRFDIIIIPALAIMYLFK